MIGNFIFPALSSVKKHRKRLRCIKSLMDTQSLEVEHVPLYTASHINNISRFFTPP